jgi:hypothetical protein
MHNHNETKVSIQNRANNSGVHAWLCCLNEFKADDDDLYTFLTLIDFLKEIAIEIGDT